MTDSPNLKLPYLLAAQAQKHVTHNEAIRALDALVHMTVIDRNLAAPPASPADGACYIVDASPSGAWAGKAGQIAAYQDGAWMFYAPKEGWRAWVADEDVLVVYSGSAWAIYGAGGGGGGGSVNPTPLVGVNATADATNRLSVNSPASLFNHVGTGGHQIKINKAAAGDTASVLFQTGFSGRAEFGTAGDDNFHVKVSANGAAWTEAITIKASDGKVGLGTLTPIAPLDISFPAGPFTAPAMNITRRGNALRFSDANPNYYGSIGYSDFTAQMFIGFNSELSSTAGVLKNDASGTKGFAMENTATGVQFKFNASATANAQFTTVVNSAFFGSDGKVGIGTVTPTSQLQLSTDSAAKPGTNTWTIASDQRLKENIVPANLERCWDIVKGVPLKRYTWKGDAYAADQVADRSKLGWIAQDVQPFFRNAVTPHVFQRPPVEIGVEEYQEQETVQRTVDREVCEIVVRDGKPVQVRKLIRETVDEPVFDIREVVDEAGQPVRDGTGQVLTHRVPRMATKTRPKMHTETIDDCLSLNADQIYAAMYGALQHAINKIEVLESEIKSIKAAPGKAY